MKRVTVQYFALLREISGCSEETLETTAETPMALYHDLQVKHGFPLTSNMLKVAVNETFSAWGARLEAGDVVVFIPPVAGG